MQYQTVLNKLGDLGPQPTYALLTTYDQDSIMNYCKRPPGYGLEGYHLTDLDVLGAEMTYPLNVTYPIGCLSGCFLTASGGAITRTDGVISTNWTMRGGENVIMVSPVTGLNVTSVNTSALPGGTSQLTFHFQSPRTGAQLTTSGTLVNSNTAHAALVAAAIGSRLM
jgi:hypothetical protein